MPTRLRLMLFSVVTVLGVALDQLTKAAARAYLASRPPIVLLDGIMRLAHSENTGAFLGLGATLPPAVRTLLFGIFAAALLAVVTVYLFTARDLTRLGVVAASLLVAGGLGNLIDRMVWDGRVTDFVSLGIGPLRTGIFNIADVFILAGVGWFLVSLVSAELEPRRWESKR
jgi:signal peptidase II